MSTRFTAIVFATLMGSVLSCAAMAGFPSLKVEHQRDDIVVEIQGVTTRFTVIRDHSISTQWYYVPDQPRIAERIYANQRVPEFALVKYQTATPDVEGGLLQVSFDLSIPAEAITQIKKQIAESSGSENIALAPLPIKSASVYLFSPVDGNLLSNSQTAKDGLAPTFATQNIAIQMELSRLGSEVYEALTTQSEGGVGVAVEFTYAGLTPELGCKASVRWEEIHDFFSKNQQFAASVGFIGKFGANAKVDTTKVREELKTRGLYEFSSTTGEGLSVEDCERIAFKPLMSRITQFMSKSVTANPSQVAKQAKEGFEKHKKPKKGWFGSASYSMQLVDVETVKSFNETVTFKTRSVVEQKTVASGFVGIGGYPEEVRNRAVLSVSDRPWDRILVNLPIIPLEYEVSGVEMSLLPSPPDGAGSIPDQDFRWKPDVGWTDYKGEKASYAYFPLADLGLSDEVRRQLPLKVSYTVVKRGQAMNIQTEVLPDEENNLVEGLLNDIEAVRMLDDGITWSRLNENNEGVIRVTAKIKTQDGQKQLVLRPRNVNGQWTTPETQYLLVKNSDPVSAEVSVRLHDGTEVPWEFDGMPLRESAGGLEIAIDDSVWRR